MQNENASDGGIRKKEGSRVRVTYPETSLLESARSAQRHERSSIRRQVLASHWHGYSKGSRGHAWALSFSVPQPRAIGNTGYEWVMISMQVLV